MSSVNQEFKILRTELCYRFGERLIAASAGAIGKIKLPYLPANDIVKSPGEIVFRKANGTCTVEKITQFVANDLISDIRNNLWSKYKDSDTLSCIRSFV